MKTEKIMKQIEIEMETLKFYQSFFLPVGSGIVASFITRGTLGTLIASSLIALGLVFLFSLYLRRNKAIKRIKLLIEKL